MMLILEDIATFLKGESLYYIKGKELTVAVIGNDDPRALPIIEIVPVNGKELTEQKEREEQKGWQFGTIKS